jgi:hypothetical protein
LAIGELREEGGSAGEAAALLRAAIRRIRACLEGAGASGAAVAVRPFYLGPARGAGRIDGPEPPFHPFLAGMEIRVSAGTGCGRGSGGGSAAETAAAAACYNLGLVHHLAGLRRASRDRSDREQEGGGPGPKAGSRLRKALVFYRLAGAALGAEGGGEGEGGADSNASSSSDDDGCLLLRAAILANTGHARLLLRGTDGDGTGEDAGRRVRACADGLAGLLRDPARAGRLAWLVLQGREDEEDEDQDEDRDEDELEDEAWADESAADPPLPAPGPAPRAAASDGTRRTTRSSAAGGVLLLSLELNVLLHSEAGRPAPCA